MELLGCGETQFMCLNATLESDRKDQLDNCW